MDQATTSSIIDDISGFPSLQRLEAQRKATREAAQTTSDDLPSAEVSEDAEEVVVKPVVAKKRKSGRPKKGEEPIKPVPKITDLDLKRDEFNHFRLRKEAQKRVPKALAALDEILDPDSAVHSQCTPAQLLKAVEIVLDRAGDKPATAPPAPKEEDTQDYILMDRSQLPTIH